MLKKSPIYCDRDSYKKFRVRVKLSPFRCLRGCTNALAKKMAAIFVYKAKVV